jgi:hypothetical protein
MGREQQRRGIAAAAQPCNETRPRRLRGDAPVDVAALRRSRQVEIATQERGRIGHRAHHGPRLAAAFDQLVQQLTGLAPRLVRRDRLDASHDTTSVR